MIRLANSEFGDMKKSSDWVRQPALDKMLDQLVEERGCTPAELIPYDAGQALGIQTRADCDRRDSQAALVLIQPVGW